MRLRTLPRGLTLTELAVTLACLALLLALTCTAIGGSAKAGRAEALSIKDATHAKQLHQCLIIFSREFNGMFPRPGLIDRLPLEAEGRDIPGRGLEDVTQNTTARLYSALIMQNYFNPELAVSPIERNPKVKVMEDYVWNLYDPGKDTYWDENFAADLADDANASYAHLPMFGTRGKREWRETFNAAYVVLGNRGPKGGERDVESFTCGPHGFWAGNLAFNDNHTEMHRTMTPEVLKELVIPQEDGEPMKKPDNVFAMELGMDGFDVMLTFTKSITAESFEYQHD